jgi:hypothetical protein
LKAGSNIKKIFMKLLQKQRVSTLGILIAVLAVIAIFCYAIHDENHEFELNRLNDYKIYALSSPDSITFAGENVPIQFFDIKESLDRELLVNTYWQSHSLLYLKRANRYFPIIEKILRKNNIPEDFKYLALIESDLKNVVSPAGAAGIWQFLEGTAKDYGLTVNNQIDERYHLEKATQAACMYFLEAYDTFNNWTLVAASFNAGQRRIREELVSQHVDNYYNLKLNSETARYVFRIIAAKLILEDPMFYGFHTRDIDLYPPLTASKVAVNQTIPDLATFAKAFGINYKLLKLYNPWLRSSDLTVESGDVYYLSIPDSTTRVHMY